MSECLGTVYDVWLARDHRLGFWLCIGAAAGKGNNSGAESISFSLLHSNPSVAATLQLQPLSISF
jgi:hypothetical protein